MAQDILHVQMEKVSFVCWRTVEKTLAFSFQIHQAVITFLLGKVFSYPLLYSNKLKNYNNDNDHNHNHNNNNNI